jgi:hypothetical protein
MLCAIVYIKVKTDIKTDVCLFKKFKSQGHSLSPHKAVITYTRKKRTQENPATATTHNINIPRTRRKIRTSVNDSA